MHGAPFSEGRYLPFYVSAGIASSNGTHPLRRNSTRVWFSTSCGNFCGTRHNTPALFSATSGYRTRAFAR